MIDKVKIRKVAIFNTDGIELNLKKINYIFGSNGTGKTTISEFLRNNNDQRFSSCEINWERDNNFDIFVYNKHFVEENLTLHNELKGIFTLGKESSDKVAEIKEKIDNIEKHEEKIEKLDDGIKSCREQLKVLNLDFLEKCWSLKIKYDDKFKEAFKGFRNSKERFLKKCITEAKINESELRSFDYLIEKIESVFDAPSEKQESIPEILYDISLETDDLFETAIIGKEDLDIARLINRLDISDWVRQGQKHLGDSNGICPFCQQVLPNNLEAMLNKYFDDTYMEQINALTISRKKYEEETDDLLQKCHLLASSDISFINKGKITEISNNIRSIFRENVLLLEKKSNELSRSVKLESISSDLKQLNLEIEQANLKIAEMNRVIDNIRKEKDILTGELWRFIVEENKTEYKLYTRQYDNIRKVIEGMQSSKDEKGEFRDVLSAEVVQLQSQLTSVLPSISAINSLLLSLGFTSFELAETEEKGNYKIVRENGEDANQTLSEGEKTFISFLYFYQLIFGVNIDDSRNMKKIVVVDDPISSLDSNVLFIVSSLLNDLKKLVRDDDSALKQLIILTHNVYFHKEISFKTRKKNGTATDEGFWVLRKTGKTAVVKEYEVNPIKTSYELLWTELKENAHSITTPNVMRRILDTYFKFCGNVTFGDIIESFPMEERVVCRSLLSWAHDGSHHISDNLYIDSNHELTNIYFDVFKKIFVYYKQKAHYDMMMGEFAPNFSMDEVQSIYNQAVPSRE